MDITVLSWNINGPGRAGPRNHLVPLVVDDINPDVLLLQETTTNKLITLIEEQCQNRSYLSEVAGDKKQARILYDSDIFEPWIPSGSQPAKNSLLDCVADFPQRYRIKTRRGGVYLSGLREFYDDRVAAVRLRHVDTGEVIVFMSFHNKRTGANVREIATDFCAIVSKNANKEHENTLVVAGADLNCSTFKRKPAHVPDYGRTPRSLRRATPKVDYFVSAWPRCITVKGGVRANDVTAVDDPDSPYTVDEYESSLDHDPLVWRLKVR